MKAQHVPRIHFDCQKAIGVCQDRDGSFGVAIYDNPGGKAGEKYSQLDGPTHADKTIVVLTFEQAASIDVLVRKLQKAKEKLEGGGR